VKNAEIAEKIIRGISKNTVFQGCHPEAQPKDPKKITGFFTSLRMTLS
jgi:hypothetical protein